MKNQQANMLREQFKVFDRDVNGLISASELRQSLLDNGQSFSAEEISEMIKKVDVDGDGNLNYEEFLKLSTG
jgi:Ca2+-binding EF-hand superfamily protein